MIGTWFACFLALTVALLAAVVFTGLRAMRPVHLVLVTLTVLSLGTTIYWAEQLGTLYDLKSAGRITPIHLTLAKITTLAYLLPVVTGVMTIKDPRRRPLHRKLALLVLLLTVITFLTGTWMLLGSTPLDTAG